MFVLSVDNEVYAVWYEGKVSFKQKLVIPEFGEIAEIYSYNSHERLTPYGIRKAGVSFALVFLSGEVYCAEAIPKNGEIKLYSESTYFLDETPAPARHIYMAPDNTVIVYDDCVVSHSEEGEYYDPIYFEDATLDSIIYEIDVVENLDHYHGECGVLLDNGKVFSIPNLFYIEGADEEWYQHANIITDYFYLSNNRELITSSDQENKIADNVSKVACLEKNEFISVIYLVDDELRNAEIFQDDNYNILINHDQHLLFNVSNFHLDNRELFYISEGELFISRQTVGIIGNIILPITSKYDRRKKKIKNARF